ncbi:hypothetical protein OU800_00685 [Pseudomonas sp. GOM7]|uniref:hypothetical protein n=1 Tax=unclassified Pseudomonas TaxID=196821 RepID=UPI00227D6679|nr:MULTISPECIES: hypothetical protein [unclassified Pseudomonas]WAJ37777.1 hypothetical protein OU800_00685 [Pseudomonas sp. GOM7]
MYLVRLSLFCAAACLINGAYAKDFSDALGASAKTAEFTVATPQVRDYRVGAMQGDTAELKRQAAQGIGDDARWLRISDQRGSAVVKREPRPVSSGPRWVF